MSIRYGICTGCEQKQKLRRDLLVRKELEDLGYDEWEIGENANFVVDTHDFPGLNEMCEGSGLISQYIFPE